MLLTCVLTGVLLLATLRAYLGDRVEGDELKTLRLGAQLRRHLLRARPGARARVRLRARPEARATVRLGLELALTLTLTSCASTFLKEQKACHIGLQLRATSHRVAAVTFLKEWKGAVPW